MRAKSSSRSKTGSNKGSVLILVALFLVVFAGVAGLALDLTAIYVVWNHELTLAESTALSAAIHGKPVVTPGVAIEFAETPKGPWRKEAQVGDRIARATRTAVVPHFFMQAFSPRTASTLRISAIAERTPDGPALARLVPSLGK